MRAFLLSGYMKNHSKTQSEHPFAKYIRILGKGKTSSRSMTRLEAADAMSMILNNQIADVQLGAFLMLLRVKEESPEELAGFVDAVRHHIHPQQNIPVDLDWSSYAGKKKQLPYYLLSCFLLAENGIRVYMHGTNGHTAGRLYTQQVLEYLNIPIANTWQEVSEQLTTNNFAYMPLQSLCPRLQDVINLRDTLGLRSPVHTLSRLLNPCGADYSIQSIFHPSYAESHQRAAELLNQKNAAVFKGEGGEIERRPEATCTVKRLTEGQLADDVWPKLLEGRQQAATTLSIDELKWVWRGEKKSEYAYHAIIGTTAIALKLLGKTDNQEQAIDLAKTYWEQRNKNTFI